MSKPCHPSADKCVWSREPLSYPQIPSSCFRHCRAQLCVCHCCEQCNSGIDDECKNDCAARQTNCWSCQHKDCAANHACYPNHYDVHKAHSADELMLVVLMMLFSGRARSEERRVGKECRSRWSP